MVHHSVNKIFKILIITCLLLCSCQKKENTNTITKGQWLENIINLMNIQYSDTEKPYFINIDKANYYFPVVQTAVEWGIIDTNSSLDVQQVLDKQYCCYTLVNLAQLQPVNASFKDSNETIYANYIQASINYGLFTLDTRNRFYPKRSMDKDEALVLLKQVIQYYDNKEIENSGDYINYPDYPILNIEVADYNEENNSAIVNKSENLQQDDIVQFYDNNNNLNTYQIEDKTEQIDSDYIEDTQDYETIYLSPIEYDEVISESEYYYSEKIDFNDAIIEFESYDYQEFEVEQLAGNNSYKVNNLAYTHQNNFGGFKISYTIGTNSINISATKSINNNDITATFKLYDIKPVFIYKTNNKKIEHAKLELRCSSLQSLQINHDIYKQYYSDLSDLNKDNFLNKIMSLKDSKTLAQTIFPIATINIPIPQIPTLVLKMKIGIKLAADGSATLKLINTHDFGFEYKNGLSRIIKDNNNDTDFILKSSAYALANLSLSAYILNINTMDIAIDSGIKASASSTIHIYDDQGNLSSSNSSIAGDLLEQITPQVNDVLCCIDIKPYLILNLILNSSSTLLSKFGLYKKIEILNEENNTLLKKLSGHIEDGIFVDKCTRKTKTIYKTSTNKLKDYQRITLKKYSYVIDKNKTLKLELVGIPNDITYNDLRYLSNDSNIATVSDNGTITGINPGATTIEIYDSNNKYKTSINIVVRLQ